MNLKLVQRCASVKFVHLNWFECPLHAGIDK